MIVVGRRLCDTNDLLSGTPEYARKLTDEVDCMIVHGENHLKEGDAPAG